MNQFVFRFHLLCLIAAVANAAWQSADLIARIENIKLHDGRNITPTWFLPRVCIIPQRTNATGLKHRDGVFSTANTEKSDFFICIGDQPELDFGGQRNADGQGFAAFGKVAKGMKIVRKIQQAPAEAQRLTPPIKIMQAKRLN